MNINTNLWLESQAAAERRKARRERRNSIIIGCAFIVSIIILTIYIARQ